MTVETLRALAFTNDRFDDDALISGLRIDARGRLQTTTEDAAVRQSIMLLLHTRPGERVMRPDYGCDLYRLLFSENDATTAGLAIHYVRRAVTRFEPRVDIERLDAAQNTQDPSRLDIELEYRLRSTLVRDRLNTHFDLQPGASA